MRDLRAQTAGKADQPFEIFFEDFLVDAWAVIKTFEIPDTDELDQVAVTHLVLAKQHERIRGALQSVRRTLKTAFGRDINFRANDRLYPRFLAGIVELDRAEHIAVVGDGKRGHIHFFG